MNITCVGGGPGGLWFAIAATIADPTHQVTVLERRPPDTTYGWGIVYWDDLLAGVRRVDPATARELAAGSVRWAGQRVVIQDRRPVHLGGSGYSLGRHRLIDILVRRARSLGVRIEFEHDVADLAATSGADLVVLSDGANSRLRRSRAEDFGTQERAGRNKHIWLGARVPFPDFTFAFEKTEAGWLWFHAYRFARDASTVIVECTEDTWRRLGLDTMDDDTCRKELARIFARHLDGAALEGGSEAGTSWATFSTMTNERWHADDAVLLGDCAHTSHFSIGSGTKLALQDAAALGTAVASTSPRDLPAALQRYQEARLPVVRALQRDAARSAAWFEHVDDNIALAPLAFGYALRTRRDAPEPVGSAPRRSSLDYRLHRATQWRVGRVARRAAAATRQAAVGRQGG